VIRRAALAALRAYRALVSPCLPVACRFTPTCSRYASEAVERHGVLRGGALALRRLLRCRPLGGRGLDPVP
jgi:putative membrane protein insertion efficiency factor